MEEQKTQDKNMEELFIYRSQLDEFLSDGTLSVLTVCFSRLEEERYVGSLSHDGHVMYACRCSEGEGRYVQDGMRKHSRELAEWVMKDGACVCMWVSISGVCRY